jgi:hypothetical protein
MDQLVDERGGLTCGVAQQDVSVTLGAAGSEAVEQPACSGIGVDSHMSERAAKELLELDSMGQGLTLRRA